MKGTNIVAIIIALVIGVAGGWYAPGGGGNAKTQTDTAIETPKTVVTQPAAYGDFKPHAIEWTNVPLLTSDVKEGFKNVDMKALSEPQRQLAIKIMNNEKCSCGCKTMTVAQCSRDMGDCQQSQLMARYIVEMIQKGKSEEEVSKELWTSILGQGFAGIIDQIKPGAAPQDIAKNIASGTLMSKFPGIVDALKGNPDELYLLMSLSSAMMQRKDNNMFMAFRPGATQLEMLRGFTQQALNRGPDSKAVANLDPGNSPFDGPKDAPITLVEFSDYQCPYSKKVQATVADLKKQFPGKIKHVFKNYPLPMHKQAELAARASLAAEKQGKYWEMHDKLFEDPRNINQAKIMEYARQIRLNTSKLQQDMESEEIRNMVKSDMSYGQTIGVRSTPTIYINGHLISGAQNSCVFKELIMSELKN